MNCPRCGADLPEVAHFCHVCGADLRTADQARRRSFAVKPDEPVASFALISTIMPRGAAAHPQSYRVALTIALVVALVAAIFGALPIAILVAAFAVPDRLHRLPLRREPLGGRAAAGDRPGLRVDRAA